MKESVSLKTGIPMDILNGLTAVKEDPKYGRYGKSPRDLVIIEGRNGREIDENFWVDSLLHRFRASQEKVTIISDCRFPHVEGTRIRETLGKDVETLLVIVRRPSVPVKRGDVTEDLIADVDPKLFDFVIVNDGTLDDLRNVARQLADMVVLRAKTRKKRPSGWSVACGSCGGRIFEPVIYESDATIFSANHEKCELCGHGAEVIVAPCVFDLLV